MTYPAPNDPAARSAAAVPTRALGRGGPAVSALGLGCMGMSKFYGPSDRAEAETTLHRALDLGVTFVDTADMYGPYTNEKLVGRVLRASGRRDQVVLATKFGIRRDPADPSVRGVSGRPAYVRASCEGSLRRLGVEVIDLYYQHRVDPDVPVEETVGAMARLVAEGKVRALGLSEAGPASIRRAHATHPIAALQSEWSLWTREIEAEVVPLARSLGIALVPYSPLGRGFLTGRLRSPDDFAPDDYRRQLPRFQGEHFGHNLELVARVRALAAERGCTPGQLALAWLLAQGDDVIPIPGTKRVGYLEENLAALAVRLTPDDVAALDAAVPPGVAAGARYTEGAMRLVGR